MIDLSLVRLIRGVEEELQRAPQTRSWREQVRNAINAEMYDLLGSREWPFLVVQRPLWVFPDFTLTGTQITLPSAVPRRVFDIPSVSGSLVGTMWPAGSSSILPDFLEQLVGAEVGMEESDPVADNTGNWRDGPFTIERVLFDGGDSVRIWLDPRCNVTSLPSTATLHVRFPRYLLSPDLAEIIAQDSLTDERGVPLAHKPPSQFLRLAQGNGRPPRTMVGTPRYFTVDEGIDWQVPPDRLVSPNIWMNETIAAPRYDLRIPTPQFELNAVASGGGNLVPGRYRVAVCFYVAGRFGPLSNVYEVTTTDANRTITATHGWLLPPDAFLAPDNSIGWYLAAFIAEGDGPLMLHGYTAGPNQARGSDYTITLLPNPTMPWKGVRYDDVAVSPPRFLRLLPRPSAHQRLSLRYRRRPTPLVHDEDVPPFPAEFHRALVYGAAARLAEGAQIGGAPQLATAARMRAAAIQIESRMRAQYFPEGMLAKQKGMIGGSGMVPDPLDINSIDYNGDT